jgi:phosphoglycolate phosphatase
VRAALGLVPRPDEAIRPWVNRGMDQLYRACFDDYVDGADTRLAVVRTRYEADYLQNVAHDTRLYPGIADSLARLADVGRLAVITNKPEGISRRLLEALGVDRFVAAVIGGDTCAAGKPDPLVFAEAARRCGFHAARDRAVMVGDTTADVALGRAVGAATIWCAWGYLDRPGEEPDFVATHPADLPGLVQQALSR